MNTGTFLIAFVCTITAGFIMGLSAKIAYKDHQFNRVLECVIEHADIVAIDSCYYTVTGIKRTK